MRQDADAGPVCTLHRIWERIAAFGQRTVMVGHGVSGAVLRGLHLGLDARAMFILEKPQDAFFRLLAGAEVRISCE